MKELAKYHWDATNATRMGKYMTSRELGYVRRYLRESTNVHTILEVGCGSGRLAVPLCDDSHEIVGLDYDELPLLWLQKKNKKVAPVRGDAQILPFRANCFDCIIAIQLAGYIEYREKFYAEILRVLKPHGVVLIQFSNKKSIKGLVYRLYLKLKKRKRVQEYYKRDYKQQARGLESAGFRIVDAKGYHWNLLQRNSNNPLIHFYTIIESLFQLKRLPSVSPQVLVAAIKEGRS